MMKNLLKKTSLLGLAFIMAGCGLSLGDKISETDFTSKLSANRSNFNENMFVSMVSKGHSTEDFGNELNEIPYDCTYNKGDSQTETIKTVLKMTKWDLDDIKNRISDFTDQSLKYEYFENTEKEAIYVSASYGSSYSLGDITYSYTYDFEYGFNKYGLLFYVQEHIDVPSDLNPNISNTLFTNLDITWTFAE